MDFNSKIRAVYRIEYADGCVQYKNLISHFDFTSIIRHKQKEAYQLELNNDYDEANAIEKELVDLFGKYWFTDKSPLFKSVLGGIMYLNGHEYPIKLTKVEHTIRDEVHTRQRFAAKEMERQVNRIKSYRGDHPYFSIASSKWSRKFVQAKKIYDYYVEEFLRVLL